MPKSNKHKAARKADFVKTKLKLGKGKEIQQNATNTSFASKSIGLPNQSLAEVKGVPTSKRNLSLQDLLIQARHYSVPVKKEALAEIHQLLLAYPYLLQANLLPLISSISHLISDPIPTLRTATFSLLSYIFSVLPQASLESSTRGLTLFTISALSSLDEGVRIDALKVLDLLLAKVPQAIVQGWEYSTTIDPTLGESDRNDGEMGTKIVEALLSVMRVRSAGLAVGQGGFTSAASADLSPSSRLAILTTLSTFLTSALSPTGPTEVNSSPWYLSTSFATPRQYSSFVQSFTSTPDFPRTSSYLDANDYDDGDYIEDFSLAFGGNGNADLALDTLTIPFASTSAVPIPSTPSNTPVRSTSLLSLLHPTLLSSFLDSAPSAFSPTPDSSSNSHLTTISAVIAVARELFWAELGGVEGEGGRQKERERESARGLLVTMLGYVEAYFPFGGDELQERSKEAEAKLLQLNLTFASLVSLLVLSTPTLSISAAKKKNKMKGAERVGGMVEGVREWVIAALRGEITSTSYPLGQALTPTAYLALEPTIWSLLNQAPSSKNVKNEDQRVLDAVLYHFAKTASGNDSKKRSFEFVARIVLIQSTPGYNNRFALMSTEKTSPIGMWLLSLPKYLWELGGKSLEMTDLVLEFLGRVTRMGSKGSFDDTILSHIIPSLAPFFHLSHATRGDFPGPFNKLSTDSRRKAVHLVESLLDDLPTHDKSGDGLAAAVRKAVELVRLVEQE